MLRKKLLRSKDTFVHDGKRYDLKALKEKAKELPVQVFQVADLKWVLPYRKVDKDRLKKSNMAKPIFVTLDSKDRLTVIDGAHRLTNAVEMGWDTLQGRFIEEAMLRSVGLS